MSIINSFHTKNQHLQTSVDTLVNSETILKIQTENIIVRFDIFLASLKVQRYISQSKLYCSCNYMQDLINIDIESLDS